MAVQSIDRVPDHVRNRRYCFAIMPYRSLGLLYQRLHDVIEQSTGLKCIRADDIPGSGQPLLDKVHKLIDGAEVVLAELSEPSPNVYYEVGYAAARKKKVLIACREGTEIPTDLRGLECITYVDTPQELPRFETDLCQQLKTMLNTDFEWLRAMLVAPNPSPSYLLANPRGASRKNSPTKFTERFTHGDNLGVLGILYALGAVLDEGDRPELISAKTAEPKLVKEDNNLYLIGAPGTNKPTGVAMEMLQRCQPDDARRWDFPGYQSPRKGSLTGWKRGEPFEYSISRSIPVPDLDWGLILRGPRPENPRRRLLVLAGVRSFGTGAACLAATTPKLIREIASFLPDVNLATCEETIWALVKGEPDKSQNGRLTEDRVTVDSAGLMR